MGGDSVGTGALRAALVVRPARHARSARTGRPCACCGERAAHVMCGGVVLAPGDCVAGLQAGASLGALPRHHHVTCANRVPPAFAAWLLPSHEEVVPGFEMRVESLRLKAWAAPWETRSMYCESTGHTRTYLFTWCLSSPPASMLTADSSNDATCNHNWTSANTRRVCVRCVHLQTAQASFTTIPQRCRRPGHTVDSV